VKIISLLVLITISIFAQDDSIIKLFPGKWKMTVEEADIDFGKSDIFEEWETVDENELVGTSYNINLSTDEKYISEILFLKKFGDQWAYVAAPVKQTITLFALDEYSENKFIFENKEHDFPQKIIYDFKNEDELIATLEGIVNGKLERVEFVFTRIKK
jgi:hypothetical protein